MTVRLMDLSVDYAFKQVFGRPGNEPILLAFLNAALESPAERQITWIEFMNVEYDSEYVDDKKSVLDILARTATGELFNIEIQVANLNDMDKRTLYYWSRIFDKQMQRGMNYKELRATVTINILNFRYLPMTERYHTMFLLLEYKEYFPLTDVIAVHFMELPKLLSQWEQGMVSPEEDQLVRWLLLLEASHNEGIRGRLEGIAMEDAVLQQAFEAWENASLDDANWWAYEMRRKAALDELARTREIEETKLKKEELRREEEELRREEEELRREEEELRRGEEELRRGEEELRRANEKRRLVDEKLKQARLALDEEKSALDEEKSALEQSKSALEQKMVQALDQGKQENQREIALRMLALGLPTTVIAQVTGLTETEL